MRARRRTRGVRRGEAAGFGFFSEEMECGELAGYLAEALYEDTVHTAR